MLYYEIIKHTYIYIKDIFLNREIFLINNIAAFIDIKK